MSSDLHPGCPDATYKPASLMSHPLGWMKARFRDVMIVAEVLHEVQYAAPWDDSQSPPSRSGAALLGAADVRAKQMLENDGRDARR